MQIETKIVSCHTADSKPVKQEVNGTVILPLLVFPGCAYVQAKCALNVDFFILILNFLTHTRFQCFDDMKMIQNLMRREVQTFKDSIFWVRQI